MTYRHRYVLLRTGLFRGLVVAMAAALALAVGLPLSATARPARQTVLSPSKHPLPSYGTKGVRYLCLASDYSCTAGGYGAASAEGSGWPWKDYGSGYASTNAAGRHKLMIFR